MSSDALPDLLVVLGTSRFGTDWPNVSAAVRAALGPLDGAPSDMSATECEERYRALIEGRPEELTALAARLQTKRLDELSRCRAEVVARITKLCETIPLDHPVRPAAALEPTPDVKMDEVGEGEGDADGSGRRVSAGGGGKYDNELEDNWFAIAEEEERNVRRVTVGGTLVKMLKSVEKHKWAYPFKRPVTDKEAPDYKDIITNPMDFATLKKKIETGGITDLPALVSDLFLIFDNAMLYNGKGSDYYRMAGTLKEIVRHQQTVYDQWRAEHGGSLGCGKPPGPAAAAAAPPSVLAAAPGAVEDAAAPAEENVRRGGRRAR